MEVLIKLSDAIKTLKSMAVPLVRKLPSAQPEPQWIPYSERLPEKDQICLVTDDTQRCAYEYGFHDETYDEENGWTYLGHKIIAWMPLPEPYRAKRRTDE